ncbi:MAG: hypothetical protein KDC48_07675 [Planctomycetes bacterium]|nr:hypothetical protein [Planctomycetota bacterium]
MLALSIVVAALLWLFDEPVANDLPARPGRSPAATQASVQPSRSVPKANAERGPVARVAPTQVGIRVVGYLNGEPVPTWCRHASSERTGKLGPGAVMHVIPRGERRFSIGAKGTLIRALEVSHLDPDRDNRIDLERAQRLQVTLRNAPPNLFDDFAVLACARNHNGPIPADDFTALVSLESEPSLDVHTDTFFIPLVTGRDGELQVMCRPNAGPGPTSTMKATYRYDDPFVEIDASSLRSTVEGSEVHVQLQFTSESPRGRLEVSLLRSTDDRALANTVLTRKAGESVIEATFNNVAAGECYIDVLTENGSSIATPRFEIRGAKASVSHIIDASSGVDIRVRGTVVRSPIDLAVWLEDDTGRIVSPARDLTHEGNDTVVHLRALQAGSYRVQLSLPGDRSCTPMAAFTVGAHHIESLVTAMHASARFTVVAPAGDGLLELSSADGARSTYTVRDGKQRLYSCPAGAYRVRIGEQSWQQELPAGAITALNLPR